MSDVADIADVVIVGAGPVGLLTAIELTLGGARVLVLERLAVPSLAVKALGLGPLGIEALMRRGMADAVVDAEARAMAAMGAAGTALRGKSSKFSGHFAGLTLIRKAAQNEPERRSRPVDQHALEAMLAERARTLGIELRRECDVTRLIQQTEGVDVTWTTPTGADSTRCAWLVACDGGRSALRKLAGFEFPGTAPTSSFYQATVEIDHPDRLLPFGWHHTPTGVFSYGPLPGCLFLLDFDGPPQHRDAPVTRAQIDDLLRRISGADVRVTALHDASCWTDNTRLVDTYRRGRVLLAGDAAHIHTPFGGQGLTLGLVDAANLGWKLAAVVRGEMPERLLDTYATERRPVAEAVLANTLAQISLMRPDPQSAAMRGLFADLMEFDDVNRRIGETTSGIATRYDCGDAHDLVGRLVGDRPVRHADGSLHALMQGGAGVLLDASTDGQLSRRVAATARRVRCAAVDTGPSLLIRPDACVAWAGDDDGAGGLDDALRRWFAPAA